jgi:hypothetical protein
LFVILGDLLLDGASPNAAVIGMAKMKSREYPMKRVITLLIVVAAIAGLTLPLWASCDLQAEVCSKWCGIRHYDSGMQAAACRAECLGDRLNCLAKEGGLLK